AVASGEQAPVRGLVDVLRPTRAEPDDGLALHVLAAIVGVVAARRVEAVADELDAIHGEGPLAAHVLREGDAAAVGERATLAVDRHRHARVARRLDAEDADRLQIRTVVARRLRAPGAQM